MKHTISLVIVGLLLLGSTFGGSNAQAAECVGVSMPDKVTVDGETLALNGQGIREATLMKIDVYVAGLYVTEKSKNGAALAKKDAHKRLVLEFVRDVDRDKIVDAYEQSFEEAAGGKYGALKSKIKKLNGWMVDASEGDEHVYTYIPGEGLTVEINGNKKGTIGGNDFTDAFFRIWLGKNPPNPGLRRGLLGGKCD
ncbi:MAG: chalcone isomerase family protein [Myxococcota bacterium]